MATKTSCKPTPALPSSRALLKQPIYDIERTWRENLEKGPQFHEKLPARVRAPREEWIDFLGFPLASPLGVPAGPLLDSRWISLASQLGFDLPTYKTIRSRAHEGHGLPNVLYINPTSFPTQLPLSTLSQVTENVENLSITNSFGMPSQDLSILQEDISLSRLALSEGQALVVSVFGEASEQRSLPEDFAWIAAFAKESGAQIVEANFSCPNVGDKKGILWQDAQSVYEVTRAMTKVLGDTPLLLKVGVLSGGDLPSDRILEELLLSAAKGGARGICGINTVSMTVCNESGEFALGPERPTSGVCGASIRSVALNWTRKVRNALNRLSLPLSLVSCGGAMTADHFQDFLSAGADIASSATGMMWDPYLALRYHQKIKGIT